MSQDGIIFLHGIFRTARSMRSFAQHAEAARYAVLNVDYPSTKQTIEEITETIHPQIGAFCRGITGTVHFVGYSMGGLVTRTYLAKYAPKNLGRVVMLGTPNHGSEVADFIQSWWLYKKLYGPAGQQLTTQHALKIAGQTIAYELGVLAGNRSVDPICSHLINAPNDGKVSIESTKHAGMKDHRIIRATHLFFPLNRLAWGHTLHFLKTGMFP